MNIDIDMKGKYFDIKLINKALIKSAIVVKNDAKLLCPVKTGRLRGSITYAQSDFTSNVESPAIQSEAISRPITIMKTRIGTNVSYAYQVEYRNGNHYAFLRRAFIQNFKKIKEIFIKTLSGGKK